MTSFEIIKPSTLFLDFCGSQPQKLKIYTEAGELYFLRVLDGKYNEIKINIPDTGKYFLTVDSKINIVDLIKCKVNFTLPPNERERMKPFYIVHNPKLLGTPARNFTETGRIETGVRFYHYPKPIQRFFILHEIGHFYYKSEDKADLYALVKYVEEGYNPSQAYYALSKVLNKESKRNQERIFNLFNHIFKK